MTIHAFCDRVLRRFPLEAGVPPSFTILTDEDRRALLQEAANAVLHQAVQTEKSALGEALQTVVSYAGEDRFQDLLQFVASKQQDLRDLINEQLADDPFAGIEADLRTALGVGQDDSPASILAEQVAIAPNALIASAIAMLREGKKLDNELADALAEARGKTDEPRIEALGRAFLTGTGEPRADSRFIAKALREAHPGIASSLCRARDEFAALEVKRRALGCALATAALPFLVALAEKSVDGALQDDPFLAAGLFLYKGEMVNRSVGEALGIPTSPTPFPTNAGGVA